MGSIVEAILRRVPEENVVGMFKEVAKANGVGSAVVRGAMWELIGKGALELDEDLRLVRGPGVERGART